MRLIDGAELFRQICRTHDEFIGLDELAELMDKTPTVEAIPIDYIKEQIEMYDGLADICDDRWGDIYHTFSQVLRGLIAHWRKENEKSGASD